MKKANDRDPSHSPHESEQISRIIDKLQSSGEYDRLEQLFAADLLVNAEWKESMQQSLQEVVRQCHGNFVELTLEDLVAEFGPKGKTSVPPIIKARMMARIQEVLKQHEL